MKQRQLPILLVVFLLFSGCVRVQTIEPVEELYKEDANKSEEESKTKKSSIATPSSIISQSGDKLIKNIICNTSGSLKFELMNPYSREFALKIVPQFEADTLGILTTRITVNGRQLEDLEMICNKEVIRPGETVICEKSFNPLDKRERLLIRIQKDVLTPAPKNYLRFIAPGYGNEAVFICSSQPK